MTTRTDLISWKLEQIANERPQNNLKAIASYVELLIDDPEGELSKVKTLLAAEIIKRQEGQVAYQAKLAEEAASLQMLDVAAIAKVAPVK